MSGLSGYRGPSAKILTEAGASVGDVIEIQTGGESITGTLVPRYEHDDDKHIVIKLKNGYNVGISVDKISKVVRVAKGEAPKFVSPARVAGRGLPEVSILGTGGTIASRVDYRTGAVSPATTADELYSLFPELSGIATITPEIVLSVYSENLEPKHWEIVAKRVSEVVARGVSGIILTMGTDTMGYTAAALSFALRGLPVPLFIVGSQRSSDRPSSDAFLNLIGAATMAVQADFSGVYVVMHADSSDERLAVHSGTRVRKNHTSARDAFESMGVGPVAHWSRQGTQVTEHDAPPPRGDARGFVAKPKFDPRVALVKFYPSMPEAYLGAIIGSGLRGVVFEGTGLGHINSKNIELVKKFTGDGGVACMTSQCLWGRVDMNVYDTGRDLLKVGVVPLEDTLPETALAKLMWATANCKSAEETKAVMQENLAGEMTARTVQRR
ncbi:MAG TPA: Glu-tRNA(Gln) amidotransferase subunit GatD [Nitrososphaerales archaeon]|nr:Glu-tRNA(Gln) amidotransferase subunit GatD [Nitrososphaerales archaeon]